MFEKTKKGWPGIFLVIISTFLFAIISYAGEEGSCIDCHTTGVASKIDKLKEPVDDWRHSILPGVAVSCDGCHGGSSLEQDMTKAMDPKLGFIGTPPLTEIGTFCGRCHLDEEAKAYKKSLHAMLMGVKESATCTTCHGSHTLQYASLDEIIPAICSECHTDTSPIKIDYINEVKNQLILMKDKIATFEKRTIKLHGEGMPVNLRLVDDLKYSYMKAVHTLGGEIAQSSDCIDATISNQEPVFLKMKVDSTNRRKLGIGILAFVIVLFLGLRSYLKRLDHIKRIQ